MRKMNLETLYEYICQNSKPWERHLLSDIEEMKDIGITLADALCCAAAASISSWGPMAEIPTEMDTLDGFLQLMYIYYLLAKASLLESKN
jgi:hypothetical protein